ncbi:MAG: allophanate hydrolase subunit 1 [Alphaproteobacteria bacterium]|nr:allophanate hydrolase subunit 1 [Alphaproteobacteria bacterium]
MLPMPLIVPLGDRGLLVRFAETLDDEANSAAVSFARTLQATPPSGVVEVVPNLVSVLVRYDPARIGFAELRGEMQLQLLAGAGAALPGKPVQPIAVRYGGEDGPDLEEVAGASGLGADDFVARHSGADLRVLAIGFAPGFAYCGFHGDLPPLPRRGAVRPMVPAGTVLYAAGQTALTATPIPTGWHVIGRTDFINFHAGAEPPLSLVAGDSVRFMVS